MLIEQLSKELQEKAKNELNEKPNEIQSNLQHIRDWLKKQPYSNIARTDDLWLLNFLRGCKFSLQRTKEKLDNFHRVRYTTPNFYTNRDPLSADIQNLLKSGLLLPIIDEKHISIIVNWKNADPKYLSMETILKAGLMLWEMTIHENNFCMITGIHIIIDLTNFNYDYIHQINFDCVKKTFFILQNAYPLRLRGIQFVNLSQYLEIFMNFVKPLLKKYLEKVSIHRENDGECIFNFIPEGLVPAEYGGKGLDINTITEKYKTKMENYRNWFIEDEQRFSNNRITFSKENTQNVNESFRKLNLD